MIPRILRMFIILGVMALPLSCFASKEPIHINLATNDPAKVLMALEAGRQYAEKGYPIVIYLNDKAVVFGLVEVNGKTSKVQEAIKMAISKGAIVNICPTCLENYGFSRDHLLQGVVVGAEH